MRRLVLFLVPLLSLAHAAQAGPDPLVERARFLALQRQDPELAQAMSVVIAKGFLPELAAALRGPRASRTPPSGNAGALQRIAMRHVKTSVRMTVENHQFGTTEPKRPKKIAITRMTWEPGDPVAELEFRLTYTPSFFDPGYPPKTVTFRVVTMDATVGTVTGVREGKLK